MPWCGEEPSGAGGLLCPGHWWGFEATLPEFFEIEFSHDCCRHFEDNFFAVLDEMASDVDQFSAKRGRRGTDGNDGRADVFLERFKEKEGE